MLSAEQENYIIDHAYVPEHSVGLMTSLSGGEPFLIDDCFCCCRADWMIFIGYPLQRDFTIDEFETNLAKIKEKFKPRHLSLIAPELPKPLAERCREKESDDYYTLNTRNPVIRSKVKRNLRKAGRRLRVERSTHMTDAHHDLMREFTKLANPPVRIKNLFFKMPQYVGMNKLSFVLNAWDSKEKLAAFYVVDFEAREFANYIIGCYSKRNYVLGASDLLLAELIKMSTEYCKNYIHLGLGVNDGIRRFKEKWGGKPTRRYEMCELVLRKPSIFETIFSLPKFG